MRGYAAIGMSLALILDWAPVRAQDVPSQPEQARPMTRIGIGRPQPIAEDQALGTRTIPAPSPPAMIRVATQAPETVVRGQDPGGAPPPPPPSPFGGPAGPVGGTGEAGGLGDGFWGRCCGKIQHCCEDVFAATPGHKPFSSDHCFDMMSSPVSNPFYFEDPRALTEIRPIFIWQHTPESNYIFNGGNNFFTGLQARVAFTERVSLVINKLGWVFVNPNNPYGYAGFDNSGGFGELHLGPKFTIIRNDSTKTVAALGLTFEIPTGPARVFQNTGNLSLTPYFSFAQNVGSTKFGSFNFMNTTGYSAGVDSQRTDFVFVSFHLDYDVLELHRFFPMVEMNYAHYTFNGSARQLGFEGRDMFNFGSDGTAGHDELTVAVGGRVKLNDFWQLGLAAEMNVLGGGRRLDAFRLTFDMIFRY